MMKGDRMNNTEAAGYSLFSKWFFIGLVVAFFAGVAVGYRIWAEQEDETSIKKLLSQIDKHVETLEQDNAALQERVRRMNEAVEQGNRAVQSMAGMKSTMTQLREENQRVQKEMENYTQHQEQLVGLKAENAKLASDLAEQKAGLARLERLEQENRELKSTLAKARDMLKEPSFPPQADQPPSQ